MSTTHRLVADNEGERLDVFVARSVAGLTRSYVKSLVESGRILVGGVPEKASRRLRPGEAVGVIVPDPATLELQPEAIPLDIVYEDADLVAVNKPAGMPVHPGPGHSGETLVNAVLAHCPDLRGIKGSVRPGIVHRLDRDTSGLIVVAKHDAAHHGLSEQFRMRTVEKTYLALVKGRVEPGSGELQGSIGRDPGNRKRMAVVGKGKDALTGYRVGELLGEASLVVVKPKTGRTHQIRVHFAASGHPLVGDTLYGGRSRILARQFLHAARLQVDQPSSGVRLDLRAAAPGDLLATLRALGSRFSTIDALQDLAATR